MSSIVGGFTPDLSPDAVSTAIDVVLYENYDRERQPSYLSARDEMFFKVGGIDTWTFIYDEDQNVGMFEEHAPQAEVITTDSRIGNQTTARVVKYMKSIPIAWEAFKADKVGKRDQIGKNVGDRARLTQDFNAVLNTYGDAFAGAVSTTPDGDALNASALILKSILNNLRNCGEALKRVIRSQVQQWKGSETIMQVSFTG